MQETIRNPCCCWLGSYSSIAETSLPPSDSTDVLILRKPHVYQLNLKPLQIFQSKSPTFYELNPKLWAKSSHSNRVLRLKSHENPTLGASTPTFSHFAGRPRCPSVSLGVPRCPCRDSAAACAAGDSLGWPRSRPPPYPPGIHRWVTDGSPMGHRWVSIHHGIPSGKHTKSAIENGHRNWVISKSPWKMDKNGDCP
jgi:hypothetical protein